VSGKWGYEYVAGRRRDAPTHEVKEHSPAAFARQWRETEALLGAHVGLYQVHPLTEDSPLFGDPELLTALGRLRDSGVRPGFSTSGPRQAAAVRRALGLEVEGRRLFEAVQATWNVLETSAAPGLAWAHESGAEVSVKEGLANGRLALDPPREVRDPAARHGVGPDAVAPAAVRAQPWADVVLSGAAGVDQRVPTSRPARSTSRPTGSTSPRNPSGTGRPARRCPGGSRAPRAGAVSAAAPATPGSGPGRPAPPATPDPPPSRGPRPGAPTRPRRPPRAGG